MGSADVPGHIKKTCEVLLVLQEIERKMKIFYLLTIIVLSLFVNSCTAKKCVPVVKTHNRELLSLKVDSVHVVDSVFVYVNGDTVRETRWRDRWREIIIRDTLFRCDTIPQIEIVEVERKLTFWETVKLRTWPFLAVIICFVCFIFIIKRGLGAS